MSVRYNLADVEAVASDDSLKSELELTCLICGKHLCDIEPGDTVLTLAEVARGHMLESHNDMEWETGLS